ncbi:hypothetical protein C8R45DRAFT_927892 [Mycena sanguinolenta]|nr:hypothetical protein C8R45DRAFT_927892 [Mycena sanguinolenta]
MEFTHPSVAYAAADKVIAQVATEILAFSAVNGNCFSKIHENVDEAIHEKQEVHLKGNTLRVRPASLMIDQAAYLEKFSAPSGKEVHRAVFLNTEMQDYNLATGKMGSLPGHVSRRGPPFVPRAGVVDHARLDTTTPMPDNLRLPENLQDDTVLRFTVDADPDLSTTFPYPTLAMHPVITEDVPSPTLYGTEAQRTQDPRRTWPDTPTLNLPLVLYHGLLLSLLPSIVEEDEIEEENIGVDPTYVHCMMLRKTRSEGTLDREAIVDVGTDHGETSVSRCGSAPAQLPDVLASTPHAARFPYTHDDFDNGYVVVPTPQYTYKQIIDDTISSAAHESAVPMSHFIRATSVVSATSDSDEP